jgi:hypothetical protein
MAWGAAALYVGSALVEGTQATAAAFWVLGGLALVFVSWQFRQRAIAAADVKTLLPEEPEPSWFDKPLVSELLTYVAMVWSAVAIVWPTDCGGGLPWWAAALAGAVAAAGLWLSFRNRPRPQDAS